MKNESLSKQKLNQNLCSGWKKKKRRQPKSKFLFSSSRFFLEWVSLDENFFFFFSFLLILCARWHFFTNLLSYHSNAPKTFTHRSWYMHTRALTKYHPHKPALTCTFSSFLNQNRKWTLRSRKWTRGRFFFEFEFHTLNNHTFRVNFNPAWLHFLVRLCVCACVPLARAETKKMDEDTSKENKTLSRNGNNANNSAATPSSVRVCVSFSFISFARRRRRESKIQTGKLSLISLSLSLSHTLIPKKLTLFVFPHD